MSPATMAPKSGERVVFTFLKAIGDERHHHGTYLNHAPEADPRFGHGPGIYRMADDGTPLYKLVSWDSRRLRDWEPAQEEER